MEFQPTDEQRAILQHNPENHARVLAGPGTGKSTTMVALLDSLLEKDKALRVRMLTFTRAATAELAEKFPGGSDNAPRPSTIHSFAISILLRNPGTGGFPEPLRIADTWEYKNIIRPTLAKRAEVDVRKLDKLVREMAANFESLTDEQDPGITDTERNRFRGAWNEHRRVLGYTLLSELPFALRRALKEHGDLHGIDFDLLLVDEYQDLNACDLDVLRLISEQGGCAVIGTGDDDQSIYSWRKAAPEGIRRFPKDYDPASDYSLSVTLRCGKSIVEWANHVISGDPGRPVDHPTLDALPDSPDGEVALLRFENDRAEAKGIAELIKLIIAEEGLEPKDILVLMRTDNNGTFSKPIRDEFKKRDIESSDPDFVLRVLAEDSNRKVLELLRLLVHDRDSISWISMLKLTPGVGPAFFEHVYGRATKAGKTFSDELLDAYECDFPSAPPSAGKVKTTIRPILNWLGDMEIPEEQPESGWGQWIIAHSGRRVLPNLSDEFRKLLLDLDGRVEEKQPLTRYLAQVEPLGRDLTLAQSEGVRLMTMSGSKGLTVRATIAAGVEDGLIPRPNCDLSEERRILYVAMTRAKEYAFCTWAQRRSGPTARAGYSSTERRRFSHFLEGGPVDSEDGRAFLNDRFNCPQLPLAASPGSHVADSRQLMS